MKQSFSLIVLSIVLHQIYVAVKNKLKNINKRHQNKLFNLGKQQEINQTSYEKANNYNKRTVHNFPLHQFLDDE